MTPLAEYACSEIGHDHELVEQTVSEWLSCPNFALAYGLLSEGLSVIPLLAGGKMPARRWKSYQYEHATIAELVQWFVENDYEPAIVTGEISNITVIDCDNADAVDDCIASGIESPMKQRTKRGVHFVFRFGGERNTVRVNGIDGVDRRGEGGYVKAYPDSGAWTAESILMCETL